MSVDTRMKWIKEKNITELERARQQWIEQAAIERAKCEAKRAKGSRWVMRHPKEKECLQVAHSYQVVIEQILDGSV